MYLKPILGRQSSDGSFAPPKGDVAAAATRGSSIEEGDRSNATHALMLLIPEGHLRNISSK